MRLKDEDLKEIARLVDEGWTRNQLANKYNYSSGNMFQCISAILAYLNSYKEKRLNTKLY